jgi:hypothetical protein
MAVTYSLTDGTTTIDLIAATTISIRDTSQPPSIPGVAIQEPTRVTERWALRVKGTSNDNLASQLQTLIKLLRKASDFEDGVVFTKPVYLQVQMANETGARYALVHGATDLEFPFGIEKYVQNSSTAEIDVTIEREHPWRSAAPNTLPTASTLTASDGPASPTMVHVANFRDDGVLSSVKVDDGGAFTDIISAVTGTNLFPAAPAANDALYFLATDIPFKHCCAGVATAMASFAGTLVAEYYSGAAYSAMTLGTHFTVFDASGREITSLNELFTRTGLWSINIFPPSDWATVAVDGQTVYPFRIRISAFTSIGTVPTKDGNAIYAQRKNYVEIPAASLVGDSPQTTLIRLFSPSGGGATVGKANLSRILIGTKSDPASTFEPVLNLGNVDNPAGWTTAYGTDSSSVADNLAPGRAHAAVSFATEATSVVRVTLTGDDLLSSYAPGEYLVMVRCQQIGGSPGDCKVSVDVAIGGSGAYVPHVFLGEASPTEGADDGPEVLCMGGIDDPVLLQLPFSRAYNSDSLASTDIVVRVYAERESGASVLRLYDLWLMPIHEGSVSADDPVTDTTNGSSALRGGTILDVDGGVLANRTMKQIVVGANFIPAEEWTRVNRLPELKNIGVKTRLYFLMLHYATAWDSGPLVASLGNHLACSVYAHSRYAMLRGAG